MLMFCSHLLLNGIIFRFMLVLAGEVLVIQAARLPLNSQRRKNLCVDSTMLFDFSVLVTTAANVICPNLHFCINSNNRERRTHQAELTKAFLFL